jgi:hypothetical protein
MTSLDNSAALKAQIPKSLFYLATILKQAKCLADGRLLDAARMCDLVCLKDLSLDPEVATIKHRELVEATVSSVCDAVLKQHGGATAENRPAFAVDMNRHLNAFLGVTLDEEVKQKILVLSRIVTLDTRDGSVSSDLATVDAAKTSPVAAYRFYSQSH